MAFIGIDANVPQAFGLAPAEARSVGVGWIAVLAAGAVVTDGAVGLVEHRHGLLLDD